MLQLPKQDDTVPAMLAPGEGVLNKEAMAIAGPENVVNLNQQGLKMRTDIQKGIIPAFNQLGATSNPQSYTSGTSLANSIPNVMADSGVQSGIGTVTQPISTGIMRGMPKVVQGFADGTLDPKGIQVHYEQDIPKTNTAPGAKGINVEYEGTAGGSTAEPKAPRPMRDPATFSPEGQKVYESINPSETTTKAATTSGPVDPWKAESAGVSGKQIVQGAKGILSNIVAKPLAVVGSALETAGMLSEPSSRDIYLQNKANAGDKQAQNIMATGGTNPIREAVAAPVRQTVSAINALPGKGINYLVDKVSASGNAATPTPQAKQKPSTPQALSKPANAATAQKPNEQQPQINVVEQGGGYETSDAGLPYRTVGNNNEIQFTNPDGSGFGTMDFGSPEKNAQMAAKFKDKKGSASFTNMSGLYKVSDQLRAEKAENAKNATKNALLNAILNGPNGNTDIANLGAAKRRQKMALEVYNQMNQQEKNAADQDIANRQIDVSQENAKATQEANALMRQQRADADKAKLAVQQERNTILKEQQANKPRTVTLADGTKLSGTPKEIEDQRLSLDKQAFMQQYGEGEGSQGFFEGDATYAKRAQQEADAYLNRKRETIKQLRAEKDPAIRAKIEQAYAQKHPGDDLASYLQ